MDEAEIKYRRLEDAAKKSLRTWDSVVTRFLDPSETTLAGRAANEAGCEYSLYGGYEGAERKVCIFSPEQTEVDYEQAVTRIRIDWNEKFSSATHRDILGAVMGLGIERECTGDIVVCENSAVLFVVNEISDWIVSQLESCGRAKVKCSIEKGSFTPPEPKGIEKRITVASLRLDAFVSESLDISRSKASDLIRAGLVKKQYVECLKPDSVVNEADLVSIRGYGRIRLQTVEGMTKKGRIGIRVFYYANTKNS